jgi:hypothetical protein
VAKRIQELVCSSFNFSKNTFDGIPIPMCNMLESESMTVTGRLQPRRSVDEKDCVIDERVLTEFSQEHLGQCLCSRGIEPYMEQAVRVGIDGGVQPVSLSIELNHGSINCNVIRVNTVCRL